MATKTRLEYRLITATVTGGNVTVAAGDITPATHYLVSKASIQVGTQRTNFYGDQLARGFWDIQATSAAKLCNIDVFLADVDAEIDETLLVPAGTTISTYGLTGQTIPPSVTQIFIVAALFS